MPSILAYKSCANSASITPTTDARIARSVALILNCIHKVDLCTYARDSDWQSIPKPVTVTAGSKAKSANRARNRRDRVRHGHTSKCHGETAWTPTRMDK